VINFNTGFYRKGVVVMKRREIILNYLKTWFLLDLLASFPYSWFINFDGSSAFRTPQLLRFLKIMRFIRILRLLRVLRLHRIFIRLEENIASETMNIIIKFIKLIILITFIAHWIACFFFVVGDNELPNPESWLVVAGIDHADTSTKYIYSLYWAFATMTTVGYGDIHPNTPRERALTLITMLVSCVVYAYTIGSIGNLVSRHNMYAA
jgi:Ion transport protein